MVARRKRVRRIEVVEHKCIICGKWFPAKRKDAELCSPRCRQRAKRRRDECG